MNEKKFIEMCLQSFRIKTQELFNVKKIQKFLKNSKNTIFEVSRLDSNYEIEGVSGFMRQTNYEPIFSILSKEMFKIYKDHMNILSINYTIEDYMIGKSPAWKFSMFMEVKYALSNE